ncbi:hypothetical protein F4861DRAFT_316356 [Xylaria intraflava]|nr:hypothetical protein F4861DRAFT_316356 [Xylaria intraflava]
MARYRPLSPTVHRPLPPTTTHCRPLSPGGVGVPLCSTARRRASSCSSTCNCMPAQHIQLYRHCPRFMPDIRLCLFHRTYGNPSLCCPLCSPLLGLPFLPPHRYSACGLNFDKPPAHQIPRPSTALLGVLTCSLFPASCLLPICLPGIPRHSGPVPFSLPSCCCLPSANPQRSIHTDITLSSRTHTHPRLFTSRAETSTIVEPSSNAVLGPSLPSPPLCSLVLCGPCPLDSRYYCQRLYLVVASAYTTTLLFFPQSVQHCTDRLTQLIDERLTACQVSLDRLLES